MGCKTLADQLEVTEDGARLFVETFHSQYPGIQPFLTSTINECRAQGYIETVSGRRRYLPAINSNNSATRGKSDQVRNFIRILNCFIILKVLLNELPSTLVFRARLPI
jgi:DNA polymerase I-like protein with 3'-5' exonuclease and polymerase domains